MISSDGGLVLVRAAERRLGLFEALAGCIREWRDPERVVHALPGMPRFRMFRSPAGEPVLGTAQPVPEKDADDCDALRGDPLFKLAVGRAAESGRDTCSQPIMSRLEAAMKPKTSRRRARRRTSSRASPAPSPASPSSG